MKKIRLLTISPTCEIGGSDLNLLRLLNKLDADEYEIIHVAPYESFFLDEFRKVCAKVEILEMPRIRLFKNPFKYILFLFKFFPTVFKIKSLIENNNIDIVCTSSMVSLYGALAAKIAKRPHVLIAVEYLKVLRFIVPYFYFLSDKIICCSDLVKNMFIRSKKVITCYPGIDLNDFNPKVSGSRIRDELGVSGNLVAMITRLAKWKGPEVFVRSINHVKENAIFVIFAEPVMGKEGYLEKIKILAHKLKLNSRLIITDKYKFKDIPEVIAASDIIVHASLRPEPFGLTVAEAMVMAKPVIASNLGGPKEIINDGLDGILIKPGESKGLGLAITKLLQDPAARRRLALYAGEKAVKKFDILNYAKDIDAIFKSLVG